MDEQLEAKVTDIEVCNKISQQGAPQHVCFTLRHRQQAKYNCMYSHKSTVTVQRVRPQLLIASFVFLAGIQHHMAYKDSFKGQGTSVTSFGVMGLYIVL